MSPDQRYGKEHPVLGLAAGQRARLMTTSAGAALNAIAPSLAASIPKASSVAQGAVEGFYRQFGTAGTGVRIKQLTGLYQDRAIRAVIGGGPLAAGGGGIAAGDMRLAIVGAAATITAIGLAAAGYTARAPQRERRIGGSVTHVVPLCVMTSTAQ